MPRATWRIMPARTRSLWLTTSASAGCSRSVGAKYEESRLTAPGDSGSARPPPAPRSRTRASAGGRLVRLVLALEHEAAVAPRGARRHRHRDEDHLAELLLAGARFLGLLRVRVDAPR